MKNYMQQKNNSNFNVSFVSTKLTKQIISEFMKEFTREKNHLNVALPLALPSLPPPPPSPPLPPSLFPVLYLVVGYCIEMIIILKIRILKIQKFISLKILVLERSGLHHRVENIEKFLPYKFRQKQKTARARAQLPHKKMENIIWLK